MIIHYNWSLATFLLPMPPFNASFPLWNDILCRWLYCCMEKQCVLPDGARIKAPRKDTKMDGFLYRLHHHDQSALNLALDDSVRFSKSKYQIKSLHGRVRVRRGDKGPLNVMHKWLNRTQAVTMNFTGNGKMKKGQQKKTERKK